MDSTSPVPVRVRLGQSPVEVTQLGVGCWAWGDRRYWRYEEDHGPRDVVDAFDACLEAGLDFFDTAETYGLGRGEKLLGWLARRSWRPFVTGPCQRAVSRGWVLRWRVWRRSLRRRGARSRCSSARTRR